MRRLRNLWGPPSGGFVLRLLLVMSIGVIASACGGNSSSSTTPTSPSLPTVLTETFSGTLTHNAAYTHPFSVAGAGSVTVFLISSTNASNLGDNQIPLGVSLGTWNGATCAIVIANDNVAPGSSITGTATAAGNLCVRVYDVGFVPTSSDNYELLVDHP
jgi:hypothetical protein